MNNQSFIAGYKLEKRAIDWADFAKALYPIPIMGAAMGGIPSAIYGGLTAKKDESPWWRAAKYGLGGAGAGTLISSVPLGIYAATDGFGAENRQKEHNRSMNRQMKNLFELALGFREPKDQLQYIQKTLLETYFPDE